jgi:predicted DNA-binding protein (MmcQ/YjbR family)
MLAKANKKDKHIMTAELKCFMMGKHTHDSHLIDIRIANSAIDKIRNSDRVESQYHFQYNNFIQMSDLILKRCGDS